MIAATSIQCIDIYENVVEPDIPMKSENFKITEYPMKANVEDKTGITFKGKSEECLEGHSQLFSFLKAVKSEQLIIGEKGFKIIEQPKSVFKAPLMNLRQLENQVFKNSTGFKKPGRIFF